MRTQNLLAGLLVVVAAVLAAVTTAVPATAHADFVSSTPAAGTTVTEMPRTVTLTFSEPVRTPAFVEVTGPSGGDIAGGDVRVRDTDVTQRLDRTTDPGQYTMAYRVTSADGHPISGTVRFTLAAGAGAGETTPAEEAAPQPAPTPQSQPTTGSDDGGLGTGQLVLLLGALAVAVAALAVGTRRALTHSVAMVEGGKKTRRSRRT